MSKIYIDMENEGNKINMQTKNSLIFHIPNFGYRLDMKLKILKIFLYFGNLLEPFVKNW